MGLVIVVISIVGVMGTILLGYCSSKISTGITKDIRNDIFKKLKSFPIQSMMSLEFLL